MSGILTGIRTGFCALISRRVVRESDPSQMIDNHPATPVASRRIQSPHRESNATGNLRRVACGPPLRRWSGRRGSNSPETDSQTATITRSLRPAQLVRAEGIEPSLRRSKRRVPPDTLRSGQGGESRTRSTRFRCAGAANDTSPCWLDFPSGHPCTSPSPADRGSVALASTFACAWSYVRT